MGELTKAISARKADDQSRRIVQLEDELRAARKANGELAQQAEAARAARRGKIERSAAPRAHKDDLTRILVGDMHGARMSKGTVSAFLHDVAMLDPDEIILGGDMMECGGFLAAHHVMGYVHEVEESYEDDIEATNAFLDELQKTAPRARIEYIEGNHEVRVEKWILTQKLRSNKDAEFLRRTLGAEAVLHLEQRGIRYFRRSVSYDGLRVPGWIKRGKLLITHELAGGVNAANRAVGQTAGNVVFFHTHRQDSSIVDLPGVGVVAAWNPGCLCRRQPLWKHSAPSGWTHGYAVQFVSKSGRFLHQNILIDEGSSMLAPFLNRKK